MSDLTGAPLSPRAGGRDQHSLNPTRSEGASGAGSALQGPPGPAAPQGPPRPAARPGAVEFDEGTDDAIPGPFVELRSQSRAEIASSLPWLQPSGVARRSESSSGLHVLSTALRYRAFQLYRTIRSSIGLEDQGAEEQESAKRVAAGSRVPARAGADDLFRCLWLEHVSCARLHVSPRRC